MEVLEPQLHFNKFKGILVNTPCKENEVLFIQNLVIPPGKVVKIASGMKHTLLLLVTEVQAKFNEEFKPLNPGSALSLSPGETVALKSEEKGLVQVIRGVKSQVKTPYLDY